MHDLISFPLPLAAAKSGIDSGDTAWMMVATALVLMMTPALGLFYSGLVRSKNALNTFMMSLGAMAVVSITWVVIGYSLAFGKGDGFIGDLHNVFLKNVTNGPRAGLHIPELVFVCFEGAFCIITAALISGAVVERMRFGAFLLFAALWSCLIYAPMAHWVWGGGWLQHHHVMDFAGGVPVEMASGFSALAAAVVVGARKDFGRQAILPHNGVYALLGASLLWFGWFGFNAGSALAADTVAVYALVNTNLAAAAAAVSWMAVDWMGKGRPSVVGLAVGAVCGLAAVTPASGYVAPWAAILIGMTAGVVSNLVSNWRASRLKVDDTLDVFACHGVGGIIGSLATGLFATVAVNATGSNGLLYGNTNLFFAQFVGVVVVGAYSFIGTYVILKVINIFSPLRVTPDEERKGLDLVEHGEEAYSQQD